MLRKVFYFSLFFFTFFTFSPIKAFAQGYQLTPPKQEYSKAQVVKIIDQGAIVINEQRNLYQVVEAKIISGSENGKTVIIHYGGESTLTADREVAAGDQIILLKSADPAGKIVYFIYDKYRFNNVLLVLLFFVVLVFVVARFKGLGSLIGMATSLAVILLFIIPRILAGNDPLLISIIGALVILFVTTYVAHGVSRQTTVALISTFIALFITAALARLFVGFAGLTGVGNEDLASLQVGVTSIINLKGLFLGGIIIGTLGALNDVTVSQAASIFELSKTDQKMPMAELIKKGFVIGREHILSLVNTLVLAYAGSSLFIFIFIVLNPDKIPYWVILNTETITDEIVATVAGSSGLILAVPIATLLAAWVVIRYSPSAIAKSVKG